ncbi:MAG: hypothetical protein GX456_01345 [Verrucomicrobia bacterium]|nr:hypothetical protein [Verrucomicrobiota bacterium]
MARIFRSPALPQPKGLTDSDPAPAPPDEGCPPRRSGKYLLQLGHQEENNVPVPISACEGFFHRLQQPRIGTRGISRAIPS